MSAAIPLASPRFRIRCTAGLQRRQRQLGSYSANRAAGAAPLTLTGTVPKSASLVFDVSTLITLGNLNISWAIQEGTGPSYATEPFGGGEGYHAGQRDGDRQPERPGAG